MFASPTLRADPKFVECAVSRDGLALRYAHPDLKKNRSVVLAAVQSNGMAVQYASDELKSDRSIANAAMQQNSRADVFIDPMVYLKNFAHLNITGRESLPLADSNIARQHATNQRALLRGGGVDEVDGSLAHRVRSADGEVPTDVQMSNPDSQEELAAERLELHVSSVGAMSLDDAAVDTEGAAPTAVAPSAASSLPPSQPPPPPSYENPYKLVDLFCCAGMHACRLMHT